MDWREKHENCLDCVEFTDNKEPTKMCDECICFGCISDRVECLRKRWCKKDRVEF